MHKNRPSCIIASYIELPIFAIAIYIYLTVSANKFCIFFKFKKNKKNLYITLFIKKSPVFF